MSYAPTALGWPGPQRRCLSQSRGSSAQGCRASVSGPLLHAREEVPTMSVLQSARLSRRRALRLGGGLAVVASGVLPPVGAQPTARAQTPVPGTRGTRLLLVEA